MGTLALAEGQRFTLVATCNEVLVLRDDVPDLGLRQVWAAFRVVNLLPDGQDLLVKYVQADDESDVFDVAPWQSSNFSQSIVNTGSLQVHLSVGNTTEGMISGANFHTYAEFGAVHTLLVTPSNATSLDAWVVETDPGLFFFFFQEKKRKKKKIRKKENKKEPWSIRSEQARRNRGRVFFFFKKKKE